MSIDELKKQPPAPESDFEVEPTDDSYTAIRITKYKGSDPLVVIPATMQGLPVKWIGVGLRGGGSGSIFSGDNVRDNVVAVVIPEGVTCILEGAFANCKNLSSVVLPSTLKYIGKRAFQAPYTDEGKLASIELPAGLRYIGGSAFYGTVLSSVNLPEGLVYIGEGAFEFTDLTSVSLPKSLRLLGKEAFLCNSLTDIQIPADHAISLDYGDHYLERDFSSVFSGTKIEESIALQKLLKETKTRIMSDTEYNKIENDIAKQIGVKSIEVLVFGR